MALSRLTVALIAVALTCGLRLQAASEGSPLVETPREAVAKTASRWAFQPIAAAKPPARSDSDAPTSRNPIDAFVSAKLAQEGLTLAPPASPETLCRRLAFDITGLPPSVEETTHFTTNAAVDLDHAIDAEIDRLLASPRYGEHMAAQWLDLARYADTSGFQGDPFRSMWRWRDYVIESFNGNKPFDQFTIEQLAGDLLPSPTLEQQIATGFNRNHRFNTEFGSIEDEWRVENVIDRVETTATTWMALTMGCARCHDHKYDPITQREFYQFFAFFNNIPERGVFWDGNESAFDPKIRAPLPADAKKIQTLRDRVARLTEELNTTANLEQSALQNWDKRKRRRFTTAFDQGTQASTELGARLSVADLFPTQAVLHLPFEGSMAGGYGVRSILVTNLTRTTNVLGRDSLSVVTHSEVRTQRVDFARTIFPNSNPAASYTEGPIGRALQLAPGRSALILTNALDRDAFTIAFWLRPNEPNGDLLYKLGQQALFPIGLRLTLTNQHLHLEVHHKMFEFDATMIPVELTSKETVPLHRWSHIALVMDGKRRNRGPMLYLDGNPLAAEPLKATARGLNTLSNSVPLWVGGRPGRQTLMAGLDELWIFDRPLNDHEVSLISHLPDAAALASLSQQKSPDLEQRAERFYGQFLSSRTAAKREERRNAVQLLEEAEQAQPWVMIMAERETPPTAKVLYRGQYDTPREAVSAGVPTSLGSLPKNAPTNRLGLALWLTDPSHPLTARVFINRIWERVFGLGLVRTSENFGTQSEAPSHPELLDWLARDLITHGWDVKRTLKQLFTSATYRQSSTIPPALLSRDPENRLLARGPRIRLSAEAVRDATLRASGLLVDTVGGPSVVPYLPNETPACGPELYRRSLYCIWQRTRFNPSLAAFDAPSRETCVAKRPRTNTPLQALALLNEVTYVEAARKLAERMLRHSPQREEQLRYGILVTLGREARQAELSSLQQLFTESFKDYELDTMAALRLIRNGVSKPPQEIPPAELAALTLVGSTLLNLDEFITKE